MTNNPTSKKEVAIALRITAKMTGLVLDDDEVRFILNKVKGRLTGQELIIALDDLLEKGKKPTLANIFSYERGGYDSPEIAYGKALALNASEDITVVTNDQIMQAWGSVQELLNNNAKYDASVAFKQCYERLVIEAKATGHKKPNWHISLGYDINQRADAVIEAVNNKLITAEYAKVHVPSLEFKNDKAILITHSKNSVKLLTGNLGQVQMSSEERAEANDTLKKLQGLISK